MRYVLIALACLVGPIALSGCAGDVVPHPGVVLKDPEEPDTLDARPSPQQQVRRVARATAQPVRGTMVLTAKPQLGTEGDGLTTGATSAGTDPETSAMLRRLNELELSGKRAADGICRQC